LVLKSDLSYELRVGATGCRHVQSTPEFP
jgi:hypothetical protein